MSLDKNLSGFQVEYEIKESPFGLGIFAKQFIPKGALIWKYHRGVNVNSYKSIDEVKVRLSQLSKDEQEFFMSHVYLYDGYMNEILDDGKMWNHSESPNTGQSIQDLQSTFAIRDIEPGEELLDDYGVYEYPDWFVELVLQSVAINCRA
jgi:SET domain-containing protein